MHVCDPRVVSSRVRVVVLGNYEGSTILGESSEFYCAFQTRYSTGKNVNRTHLQQLAPQSVSARQRSLSPAIANTF